MKKYIKLTNEIFDGFYDEDIVNPHLNKILQYKEKIDVIELIEEKTDENLKELEDLKAQYNTLIEDYEKTVNSDGSITNEYGTFVEISYSEFERVLNEQTGRQIVYNNGNFSFLDIPSGIKIEYTKNGFIETATLQEQVDYYYAEIKRLSREIAIATLDTMIDPSNLEENLKLAKEKHLKLSHELALQVNQIFK